MFVHSILAKPQSSNKEFYLAIENGIVIYSNENIFSLKSNFSGPSAIYENPIESRQRNYNIRLPIYIIYTNEIVYEITKVYDGGYSTIRITAANQILLSRSSKIYKIRFKADELRPVTLKNDVLEVYIGRRTIAPLQYNYLLTILDLLCNGLGIYKFSDQLINKVQFHRTIYKMYDTGIEYLNFHPYPKYCIDYDFVSNNVISQKIAYKYKANHLFLNLDINEPDSKIRQLIIDSIKSLDGYSFLIKEHLYSDICNIEVSLDIHGGQYLVKLTAYRDAKPDDNSIGYIGELSFVLFGLISFQKVAKVKPDKKVIRNSHYLGNIIINEFQSMTFNYEKEILAKSQDGMMNLYRISKLNFQNITVAWSDVKYSSEYHHRELIAGKNKTFQNLSIYVISRSDSFEKAELIHMLGHKNNNILLPNMLMFKFVGSLPGVQDNIIGICCDSSV